MTAVPRAFQAKITTFEEYQRRASRTMTNSDSVPLRQAVWALGLVGEAIEVLDLVAIRPELAAAPQLEEGVGYSGVLSKELGDVCWYIAAICEQNGISMGEMARSVAPPRSPPNEGDRDASDGTVLGFSENALHIRVPTRNPIYLVMQAGLVAEHVKKAVGHGHKLDVEKLADHLLTALMHVNSLCAAEDLYLDDVLGKNIAKLEARYPEGFSTEASISRVDVTALCEQCKHPWHDGLCTCGHWGPEQERQASEWHAKHGEGWPFLVAMVNPDDTVAEVFEFPTLAAATDHAMDLEAHTECSSFIDGIKTDQATSSPEAFKAAQKAFTLHRLGL